MEVKDGYKRTDIGVIPAEWEAVPLGSLARCFSGGTPSTANPRFYGGEVAWITSSDLNKRRIHGVRGRISAEGLANSSAKLVDKGTLLLAMYGATAGVCAVTEIRAAINQAVLAIVPRSASTEFLFQELLFLKDRYIRSYTQGGQPNFSAEIVKSFLVPLPPLAEQKAIAEALSDVDDLIASLERLIAKKRDIKAATMGQLLTGRTRLPGFAGEWERKRLGDIVSTPITDGPHLTPKFLADGVPFLSVNNLVNNQIDFQSLRFVSRADHLEFSKKCKPRKGDILFGKAASVGMVGLIETEMELNIWSPLALIRVGHPTSARFVCYALQSSQVHRQIKLLTNSSSQGNIGMREIGLLEIPLPEPIEQAAIAAVLSDMDAEIEALESRLAKTRMLKQGMMQELLTGRTRLV